MKNKMKKIIKINCGKHSHILISYCQAFFLITDVMHSASTRKPF
ncbi:hypothetical protein BGP_0320 [Beggiatoa sp. PS]|nr:hypothetical protein BGP_0320 [Beggiatoa sp. PS]